MTPSPRGTQAMSACEKPKRKFWQIHLSTAVLLMLVAGTILYKATQFRRCPKAISWDMGWPLDAIEAFPKYNGEGDVERDDSSQYPIKFRYYVADWECLAIDVVIDVGIVLSLAFVCEWLIRRRFQFTLRKAVYLIVIAVIIIGCLDAYYEATHIPPYPTSRNIARISWRTFLMARVSRWKSNSAAMAETAL